MSAIGPPKYFHLMTDAQWKAWKAQKPPATWRSLQDAGWLQPAWCSYPNALDGMMGCWSLIYRRVTGEAYCGNCECHSRYSKPLRCYKGT